MNEELQKAANSRDGEATSLNAVPAPPLRDLALCIQIARDNVDGAVQEYDEIFERAEQQLAYALRALSEEAARVEFQRHAVAAIAESEDFV